MQWFETRGRTNFGAGQNPMEREAWRIGAALLVALGIGGYFITLLKGAWLSDDYFITLRQVEQLFAGHGIRFNLYERSFLSTSVAYFFLLLPLRLLSPDPFIIHAIFALACNAVLLWVLWILARRNPWFWLLGLGLLFASKAHFDYSWFGQENPLGHALVAALVMVWLRLYPGLAANHPATSSYWRCFVVLIAIAPLYRHDFVLLAWPMAAWALWANRSRLGWRGMVKTIGWMLGPLFVWTLFSLVYFGFPLPASAYNKLPDSYGLAHRFASAWDYFRFSLHKDGIMLAVLLGSQLLWFGRPPARVIAAAIALVLIYIVIIGGDYMGGRFFSVAYVMMVTVLVGTGRDWYRFLAQRYGLRRRRWILGGLGAGLTLWLALWPYSPLLGPVVYEDKVLDRHTYPTEVANERAAWQPRTGVTVWWKSLRDGTTYPDHVTARLGILIKEEADAGESLHVCNLGLTPYNARLDQNFFDIWGLADAFMARLPATDWRPGHLVRARPVGLAESLASNSPAFVDSGLNRYFEVLRNVTGNDRLLSSRRIKELIGVNLGLYDELLPETMEVGERAVIVPEVKDTLLLHRLLESFPVHSNTFDAPLCDVIDHPGADTLLRQRIP